VEVRSRATRAIDGIRCPSLRLRGSAIRSDEVRASGDRPARSEFSQCDADAGCPDCRRRFRQGERRRRLEIGPPATPEWGVATIRKFFFSICISPSLNHAAMGPRPISDRDSHLLEALLQWCATRHRLGRRTASSPYHELGRRTWYVVAASTPNSMTMSHSLTHSWSLLFPPNR
jgi:hypothetical protein